MNFQGHQLLVFVQGRGQLVAYVSKVFAARPVQSKSMNQHNLQIRGGDPLSFLDKSISRAQFRLICRLSAGVKITSLDGNVVSFVLVRVPICWFGEEYWWSLKPRWRLDVFSFEIFCSLLGT